MVCEDSIIISIEAQGDGTPKPQGTFTAHVHHMVELSSNQEGTAPEYGYDRHDEGTYAFDGKEFVFTITQSTAKFVDDGWGKQQDAVMCELPVVVKTAYDAAAGTVQYPDYDYNQSATPFQGDRTGNVVAARR